MDAAASVDQLALSSAGGALQRAQRPVIAADLSDGPPPVADVSFDLLDSSTVSSIISSRLATLRNRLAGQLRGNGGPRSTVQPPAVAGSRLSTTAAQSRPTPASGGVPHRPTAPPAASSSIRAATAAATSPSVAAPPPPVPPSRRAAAVVPVSGPAPPGTAPLSDIAAMGELGRALARASRSRSPSLSRTHAPARPPPAHGQQHDGILSPLHATAAALRATAAGGSRAGVSLPQPPPLPGSTSRRAHHDDIESAYRQPGRPRTAGGSSASAGASRRRRGGRSSRSASRHRRPATSGAAVDTVVHHPRDWNQDTHTSGWFDESLGRRRKPASAAGAASVSTVVRARGALNTSLPSDDGARAAGAMHETSAAGAYDTSVGYDGGDADHWEHDYDDGAPPQHLVDDASLVGGGDGSAMHAGGTGSSAAPHAADRGAEAQPHRQSAAERREALARIYGARLGAAINAAHRAPAGVTRSAASAPALGVRSQLRVVRVGGGHESGSLSHAGPQHGDVDAQQYLVAGPVGGGTTYGGPPLRPVSPLVPTHPLDDVDADASFVHAPAVAAPPAASSPPASPPRRSAGTRAYVDDLGERSESDGRKPPSGAAIHSRSGSAPVAAAAGARGTERGSVSVGTVAHSGPSQPHHRLEEVHKQPGSVDDAIEWSPLAIRPLAAPAHRRVPVEGAVRYGSSMFGARGDDLAEHLFHPSRRRAHKPKAAAPSEPAVVSSQPPRALAADAMALSGASAPHFSVGDGAASASAAPHRLHVLSDGARLAELAASRSDLERLLQRLRAAQAAEDAVAARLVAEDVERRYDGGGGGPGGTEAMSAGRAAAAAAAGGRPRAGSDALDGVPLGMLVALAEAEPDVGAATGSRGVQRASDQRRLPVAATSADARSSGTSPPSQSGYPRFPRPVELQLAPPVEVVADRARRLQQQQRDGGGAAVVAGAGAPLVAAALQHRDAVARQRRINDAGLDAAGLRLSAVVETCADSLYDALVAEVATEFAAAADDVAEAVLHEL